MQKYCRLQYFCSFVNHSSFMKQHFCIQVTDATHFCVSRRKPMPWQKSPKYLSQDVYKVVKSTQSVKWYWDRAHCQRQSAIFLRKANYDWIGCAIYLHSNNKFALSQVNIVKIQYFCFYSKILECKLLLIVGIYEDNYLNINESPWSKVLKNIITPKSPGVNIFA